MKELLLKTIEEIERVTDYFYKQHNQTGYSELDQVITDISLTIDKIFKYRSEKQTINFDEQKLIDTLTEAMNAMEGKDTILLADILQYDLLEQFQDIINQL